MSSSSGVGRDPSAHSERGRGEDPATLTEAAVEALREMIIQGELGPGEHVQENRVCARLGISRTPVRAAFGVLANEGYLVNYPNRGYFVREFELADLRESWEIRSVLEGLAARKCAEHGLSAEDAGTLQQCLTEGDRILGGERFDPNDVEPYRRMNMTFHETLLRASRMSALPEVVRQTQNMPLISDRILVWQDFDHLRRSHDDHHRVVDAIGAGEGARAEALMREHVYFAGIFVAGHIARSVSERPGAMFGQILTAAGLRGT